MDLSKLLEMMDIVQLLDFINLRIISQVCIYVNS